MKKRGKSRHNRQPHGLGKGGPSKRASSGRVSDISGRGFPPHDERQRIVASLRGIPREQRSTAQWYGLGSLLVYDACLEDDDRLLNEGNEALVMAASGTPPIPDALIDLTWLLNLRGLPAMALVYAKQATDLAADRCDAWRFRANTHMQLKQIPEAIECLRKAVALPLSIESDRTTLAALEAGETNGGGRGVMLFGPMPMSAPLHAPKTWHAEQIKLTRFYAKQATVILPDDSSVHYLAALGAYYVNDFTAAERHLAQLLAIEPTHADGLCVRALIATKKGADGAEVVPLYAAALQADPKHVLACTNLAKILLDAHQFVAARPLLETAIEADPTYAAALSNYGNLIGQLEKDYAKEAELHGKALRHGPVSTSMRFGRCMALLQAGQLGDLRREWRTHRPFLEQVLEESPEHQFVELACFVIPLVLDPPRQFGDCVTAAEKCGGLLGAKAIEPLLRSAMRSRHTLPRDSGIEASAWAWLGMVAGQHNLHGISVEAFKEAERVTGKGGEATLNVAVALGHQGKHEEAIAMALAVKPGTARAASIRGNIYRGMGNWRESLGCYLTAVDEEPGFSLPIENGMDVAILLADLAAVKTLTEAALAVDPADPSSSHAAARGFMAMGFPSKAVELLQAVLYADGEPRGLPEASGEEDLTRIGALSQATAFYTLGTALLQSRKLDELGELCDWIAEEEMHNGDWSILRAEGCRVTGRIAEAERILDTMSHQPPPLLTRSLIAAGRGRWEEAVANAEGAVGPEFEGMVFNHPEGEVAAIAHGVRTLAALSAGDIPGAERHSKQATESDRGCGLAWVSLARVRDETGDTEGAIAAASEGLTLIPGDVGLLEWMIPKYLERSEANHADELLTNHRSSLESRGRREVASWLGEQVARALIPTATPDVSVDMPSWATKLEPESRSWLNSAVKGNQGISDLRLGVGIYYCKIVEREVTGKLIEPFLASRPLSDPAEHDKDLKDLEACLDSGRMPGLGAVAHSLRVLSWQERHDDSVLRKSWRAFLRGLPEPRRSAVRSREFVESLRELSLVRNHVAHLGDLTQEDFERIERAVVEDGRPGSIIRGLGIH